MKEVGLLETRKAVVSAVLLCVFSMQFIVNAQVNFSTTDSLKFKFLNTVGEDRVDNLIHISHYYADLNSDSALLYGTMALREAEKQNYVKGQVTALNHTALANFRLGNIDKALGDLFVAVKQARKHNLNILEAQSLVKVGGIFGEIGQWHKHYKYNLQATKIFEEEKDTLWMGYSYNNMGISYRHMKDYDQALVHYKKALEIAKKNNNRTSKVMAYGNMANIFWEKGVMDSVLAYQKRALELELSSKDSVNIIQKITLLTNVGSVYISLDSLQEAERYLSMAYKIATKSHNILKMGNAERFLARVEFLRGNYRQALKMAKEALQKVSQVENIENIAKINKLIFEIHEAQGNLDSALFYHKKYKAYTDTMVKRANTTEQANLKWNNLIEKKEAEITTLEKSQQILKEKQQAEERAMNILWVALGVTLLVIVLLFISVRQKIKANKKDKQLIQQQQEMFQLEKEKAEEKLKAKEQINAVQKEKHKMELNLKNKELATLTMQMLNKSETIATLKQQIDGLQKASASSNGDFKKHIKQISAEINDSISLEKDWESFKKHFEEVNKGFFKDLREKHPNLTSNDLRVCSYLHIHLDTKQIARLLNISPDAVKKKRYRLRKKMGLELKEDIAAHIAKITG